MRLGKGSVCPMLLTQGMRLALPSAGNNNLPPKPQYNRNPYLQPSESSSTFVFGFIVENS